MRKRGDAAGAVLRKHGMTGLGGCTCAGAYFRLRLSLNIEILVHFIISLITMINPKLKVSSLVSIAAHCLLFIMIF